MSIAPNTTYVVGGLRLRKTDDRWPFVVLAAYNHPWNKMPTLGKAWNRAAPNTISRHDTPDPTTVATLSAFDVTLHVDYRWDGNSGPAANTMKCLRASALHDVWCQAMKLQIYDNSLKNWRRGAAEYRRICRKDGMSRWRAWLRYVAILSYGVGKKLVGRLG